MPKKLLALVAALALVACGGDDEGDAAGDDATTTTGGDEAAGGAGGSSGAGEWAATACGGFEEVLGALRGVADVDFAAGGVAGVLDQLDEVSARTSSAVDGVVADVQDVGAPDVGGGQVAHDRFLEEMRAAGDEFDAVDQALDRVDPDDPASFEALGGELQQRYSAAGGRMNVAFSGIDATAPDLSRALGEAPECGAVVGAGRSLQEDLQERQEELGSTATTSG